MYWKAKYKMLVNGKAQDVFVCDVCQGIHYTEDEARGCSDLKED